MGTLERPLRAFVSSTLGELAAERAAACRAIESLRLTPVTSGAGRPDEPPHETLDDSDLFVGIYWESYGPSAPEHDVSALEGELRLAGDRPRLLYVKEPAPERDPRLVRLLDRARRSAATVTEISGAEELAEQLAEDIAHLLAVRFGAAGSTLPVGTITFLFADVEGSTQGMERLGDVYARLLADYRRDGAAVVTEARGTLVQTEGDGLFAVFPTADDALHAAIAAQRAYLAYPPPGPLRVRIGLHSGTGVLVGGAYTGIDVHRAARVASVAHGGQILITVPTRELIRSWGEVTATDLGWFELKGLSRQEHLLQVTAPGLPDEFPPLRAQPSSRAGLPRQLTALVGRDDDIEAIAALLESGVRLLTLTGEGGIGKTRLAVAAAERVAGRYRDGVGFIGLASVTEASQVADTIAAGLGRAIEGALSAEDVVVDELRDREFLLVLDNFEQVVDAAPMLRSLLERVPGLQLLVTSRISLHLSAEREYDVTPLALPPRATADEVGNASAVRLLLDRARDVRPEFAVTPDNAEAVASLARRLDGIPLALELAAARLRLLDPADVAQRLTTALDLSSGPVDLPARQRTLRAAIDWSFRLLAAPEQALFARLGIFAGGWTLDAAEAVGGGSDVGEVAGALDTLSAHSLIRAEAAPGAGTRMRFLGPLHDYAREVLEASGEEEPTSERHARYFATWVEDYPKGAGAGLGDWQRSVDLEWGNIRQAILWCVARENHEGVARFLVALWPHLWLENRVHETVGWLDGLRPHLDRLPAALQGQVLHIDAFFALEVGDYEHALAWGRKALEVARAVGDAELEGRSRLLVAGTLPAFDLHDPEILELLTAAVDVFRGRGDLVNLAYALNFLCSYQAASGDVKAAREAIREALVLAADIEALPLFAQSSSALAFVELISGNLEAAEQQLAAAVGALGDTPSQELLSYVLDGYGWWALARGEEIAGLTAIGAAEGLRSRLGLRPWPLAAAQIAVLGRHADSFEDPEARSARRSGRQLTPDAALAVVTAVR